MNIFVTNVCPCCVPLYAAPVSEAKAHGVVLTDEELCSIRNQVACNEVRRDDDSRTICVKHGRALEAAVLARLNATPVQQVSVPDVSAMARILADRNADACNVNREDNWAIYGQDYIDDVTAMLAAAPAADASDVLEQAVYTLISIGYHENSGLVHELRQALAAHRANGVV